MAYPNAAIYRLDSGEPSLIPYPESEHYRVTRNFLTRTRQMLDILLNEDAETGSSGRRSDPLGRF